MYPGLRFISILVTLLLVSGIAGFCQKSKPRQHQRKAHTPERYDKSITRKTKGKSKIVCPVFGTGKYPFQGLGFKLGDPFALTYKFYFSERFAVVADFGKTSGGLYNRYYRERFIDYVNADTLQEGTINYLTHRIKSDWVGELKLLWHFDVRKISPGLKVYFGVGPEIKTTHLEYQYLYENNVNGGVEGGKFSRRRVTFGPQVSIGIEYAYFQIPISAFMELEFYNDISIDPGWRRFEGGVGLRYIF